MKFVSLLANGSEEAIQQLHKLSKISALTSRNFIRDIPLHVQHQERRRHPRDRDSAASFADVTRVPRLHPGRHRERAEPDDQAN